MRRIAKFHKVSPAQFAKDWKDTFPTADEKEIYLFTKTSVFH